MNYHILVEGDHTLYAYYTEASAKASLAFQSSVTGKLAILYFERADGGLRAVGHCYPNTEPVLYIDPVTHAWTDLILAVRKAFGI